MVTLNVIVTLHLDMPCYHFHFVLDALCAMHNMPDTESAHCDVWYSAHILHTEHGWLDTVFLAISQAGQVP